MPDNLPVIMILIIKNSELKIYCADGCEFESQDHQAPPLLSPKAIYSILNCQVIHNKGYF